MTALQTIIKEAKHLKSKYPKRFQKWTEYVAQASAIYSSKHKGISPVGKKKVGAIKKKTVKKTAKKSVVKKTAKKRLPNSYYDKLHQAKRPGKRTSASGKTYYENRDNRSDKGKLLGIVKQKPTIISLSKKIKKLTDINDHNGSILLLAKFLKSKKGIELMNNVIKMQNNFGYMPKNLIDIRNEIYNKLITLLKSKYGEIDYKTIHNSF
jgi:hypothetical protein